MSDFLDPICAPKRNIPFQGHHDVGGLSNQQLDNFGKIEVTDRKLHLWELQIHALLVLLASHKPPYITTDELRRAVEGLERSAYLEWDYYEKWGVAITSILLERGIISQQEIDKAISGDEGMDGELSSPKFKEGDFVRVKKEDSRLRWRRPHIRCPGYVFGLTGRIAKFIGHFEDPFLLAFRGKGPKQPLYTVSFPAKAIWAVPGEKKDDTIIGPDDFEADCINAEVYQDWLEPRDLPAAPEHEHEHGHDHDHQCCSHEHAGEHLATAHSESVDGGHEHLHHHDLTQSFDPDDQLRGADDPLKLARSTDSQDMPLLRHDLLHSLDSHAEAEETALQVNAGRSADSHEHGHSHGHSHGHQDRSEVEQKAHDAEGEDTAGKVVAVALLRLLQEKAVVSAADLMRTVELLENAGRQLRGAELVARAWKDPAFKVRLLQDAVTAALDVGITTSNPNAPTVLRVVANSEDTHNLIVCTLCSCYPSALLGLSPAWYKSRNYRARAVREPRAVLREFGLVLPASTRVVVHDSTADCRYLVIPRPPAALSDEDIARMSIEELRALVTRDSMVGVAVL